MFVRFATSVAMASTMTFSLVFAVCPQPAIASNPFCAVDASYVPWNAQANAPSERNATTESAMRVVLYAISGSSADAIVTFISSDSAYQAIVSGAQLHAVVTGGDLESDPVLVMFDHPVNVQFAYVDSYALNGGHMSSCPSFVNQVNMLDAPLRPNTALPSLHAVPSAPLPTMPKGFAIEYARLLQPLPRLSCGALYKPATGSFRPQADSPLVEDSEEVGSMMRYSTMWQFQYNRTGAAQDIGAAGSGTTGAVVVGIYSNGALAFAQLVRSSGNTVADNRALDDARTGSYAAADFLCVPVVSLLFVQFASH